MIMMVVMIVGMIFFSSRSAKKAMEKEKEEKGKSETVNPYKEAKRTGKSVEEIVEKDKKRKAKQAEAEEKRRAEEKKIQEEVAEKLRKESNKRVSKARPISAAGSTYKVEVKKTAKPSGGNNKKGNTNPKNQTGKQKNSKNKKKNKWMKRGKPEACPFFVAAAKSPPGLQECWRDIAETAAIPNAAVRRNQMKKISVTRICEDQPDSGCDRKKT